MQARELGIDEGPPFGQFRDRSAYGGGCQTQGVVAVKVTGGGTAARGPGRPEEEVGSDNVTTRPRVVVDADPGRWETELGFGTTSEQVAPSTITLKASEVLSTIGGSSVPYALPKEYEILVGE